MRKNAHGSIARARTPWQLFNTVSRGEHEATNCDEETPPAPNSSHSNSKLPLNLKLSPRMRVRSNSFIGLFWQKCRFVEFKVPLVNKSSIERLELVRDHSSITSSKKWVGGVRKWQFLMIYSTVNHQKGGWVGLKKSKTWWCNTWMVPNLNCRGSTQKPEVMLMFMMWKLLLQLLFLLFLPTRLFFPNKAKV